MDQCTKRGKTGIWSEAKHRKAYNRTDLLPTEGGVAGVGKGGGLGRRECAVIGKK